MLGPGDYPFAARLAGQSEPLSLMCYLPPTPNVHYSACLMHCAEKLFTVRCRDFVQSFDHFDRLLLLPPTSLSVADQRTGLPDRADACRDRREPRRCARPTLCRRLSSLSCVGHTDQWCCCVAGMTSLRDGGRVRLEGLEAVSYTVDDSPKFAGGGGFLG